MRLHRALIFIEEFLRGLSDRSSSDSTVSIATSAYDSTLYYHRKFILIKYFNYLNILSLDGFFIRTTVKLGFRALPSRKQLDEILFHGDRLNMIDQYKIFVQTIKQIYDIIEEYYTEKNYLQLP